MFLGGEIQQNYCLPKKETMGSRWKNVPGLGLVLGMILSACGGEPTFSLRANENSPATADGVTEAGEGTLVVRANGEERARDGFTTKDGWSLDFNHVYVSLADINAYQTNTLFDPTVSNGMPEAMVTHCVADLCEIAIPGPTVVDIAAAAKDGETVLVGEILAPAGQFNALSWQMPAATEGPAQGYSILMEGNATKNGKTLPFTLGIQEELAFVCGDFIGDGRKGILTAGSVADLEATFHLDHLFGESKAPADDDINTGSLGFEPPGGPGQKQCS